MKNYGAVSDPKDIVTKEYVDGKVPAASTSTPLEDGTASAGSSADYARGDHVHPHDTSKQDNVVKKSISLSTTWSGSGPYTQTVTISGYTVTANSKVDLQPDATAIAQLVSDGVTALFVENNNGTLTAYAIGATTTAALTVQCTITEVTV